MSLLNFVAGVGKIAGAIFGGGDKQSSNQSSNQKFDKTGSSKSNLATVGKTEQNQTGTRDQTGKTTSTGSVTGTTDSTGRTGTSQTTSMFSSDVLAQLDSLLTDQLGGGAAQEATSSLRNRLTQLNDLAEQPGFNIDQYVQGITNQARSDASMDLDSSINSMLSASGSSEQGNSMAALLGQRMRNTAAANLAGIQSQATMTGQQIAQAEQESRTGQIGQISGQISQDLTNLIGTSAGAQQTSTGTEVTQQQQQQQQQQQEIQDILNRITESLDSETSEVVTAQKDESFQEKGTTNTNASGTIRNTPGWGKIFGDVANIFTGSQSAA